MTARIIALWQPMFISTSLLDPLMSLLPIIVKQNSPSIAIVCLLTGNVSWGENVIFTLTVEFDCCYSNPAQYKRNYIHGIMPEHL